MDIRSSLDHLSLQSIADRTVPVAIDPLQQRTARIYC
jgi:hypothetical protein